MFVEFSSMRCRWPGGGLDSRYVPIYVSPWTRLQFAQSFSVLLVNNDLNGTIPEELRVLSAMRNFDVSQNFLSGTISETIAEFTSLETFRSSVNRLSGSIPSGLGSISFLREFEVGPELLKFSSSSL